MQVFRTFPGLFLILGVCGQVMDDRLSFEVASIKPSANQGMITRMAGGPRTSDPGRFRATNAELGALVFRAYGLQYADQIKAPAWIKDALRCHSQCSAGSNRGPVPDNAAKPAPGPFPNARRSRDAS